MISKIINGDLFSTDCEVIAHQVNCMGEMNSGVAKIVKEKYPEVFKEYRKTVNTLDKNVLGGCLLVDTSDGKYIANIFGQYYYNECADIGTFLATDVWNAPYTEETSLNDNTVWRFTNYEAFYKALVNLKVNMNRKNLKSLAFPYKIGCDRGGASWNIIKTMIDEVFESTDIVVKIYDISNSQNL